MQSLLSFAFLFAFLQAVAFASEPPVKVLLYGPSEGIQQRLNELPKTVRYERLMYQPHASRHSWKLMVGLSGDMITEDIPAVLDALAFYGWPPGAGDTWKLFVHGGIDVARITVKDDSCLSPKTWFLVRDGDSWVVFDGPGTPTGIPLPAECLEFIPPPTDEPVQKVTGPDYTVL